MKFKFLIFLILLVSLFANADAEVQLTTQQINVINSTPLGGLGLPLESIPTNIQTAKSKDLKDRGSLTIADYLLTDMSGVSVNETQGNPFQPDVRYRGFNASSLLGAPQGISVYQDGVRVNEPFGDVVSWDLIPMNAIKQMTLISGTNPIYGLNTMGGALSVETKRGRDVRGGAVEVSGGSWGRKNTQFEYGGAGSNGVDFFLSGNYFDENGWRDASPTTVRQMFGQLGWQNEKTDISLTMALADNQMTGNGLIPLDMMRQLGRESVYTKPDETNNKMAFFNLKMSHWINKDTLFSGNIYHRNVNTGTFNGDLNDDFVEATGAALTTALNNCTSGTFRSTNCNGALNQTFTKKMGSGFSAQLAFNQPLFNHENQLITGFGLDYSDIKFNQSKQYGLVNADRSIAGYTDYDPDMEVKLKGTTKTYSLFATDNFSINKQLNLTLSGRYNNTNIDNKDLLDPHDDPAESLTARHTYQRLNPAIGLAYSPVNNLTVYGSYNEGTRAPTSMELGCANPGKPCKLPNAMAGDPPLNQVITETFDGGLRGKLLNDNINYSLSGYRSINNNDIQFVSNGAAAGLGYFKNIDKTQRLGIDAVLSGKFEKLQWMTGYSYVEATYETEFMTASDHNSSKFKTGSCGGESVSGGSGDPYYQCVKKGSVIPGVPKHQIKVRASYEITPSWTIGTNIFGFTHQYAVGNENNSYYEKSGYATNGRIAGYAVMNLDTQYKFGETGWQLFAKINNVFDREYNSAAMVGGTLFGTANGSTPTSTYYGDDHRTSFVSPGAPRAAWVGLRWEFGGAKKSIND